jgi:signal transduction histidine kinase
MTSISPDGESASTALAVAVPEWSGLTSRLFGLIQWAASKSRATVLTLGFALIVLIGVLANYTGSQISVSLLYLLPILFVTHFSGCRAGIVAAMLATGMWLAADLIPPTIYSDAWIPCWNAVMRLGVFLVVVWLLSAMRNLTGSLERRVEDRTHELRLESAERRELEKRILEISEREQARMGQDLHDGLCQQLVGMAFSANLLQQKLAGQGLPEAGDAARIACMLDESITQARQLARGLYPVRIEDLGLATALEDLAETMRDMFHIECGFTFDGDAVEVDQWVAVHLYRIAKEAVTNAIKHARSQQVRIRLCVTPAEIGIRVEDDGIGIVAGAARTGGMGLRIMEFRARMIGGQFQIQPGPDGGTVVSCALPLPQAAS